MRHKLTAVLLAAASLVVPVTLAPAASAQTYVAYGHGIFSNGALSICNESGKGVPVGIFFGCTVGNPVIVNQINYVVNPRTHACVAAFEGYLPISSTLGSGTYAAWGIFEVQGSSDGAAAGTFAPYANGPRTASPSQIVLTAEATLTTTGCRDTSVKNPSSMFGNYDIFIDA